MCLAFLFRVSLFIFISKSFLLIVGKKQNSLQKIQPVSRFYVSKSGVQ